MIYLFWYAGNRVCPQAPRYSDSTHAEHSLITILYGRSSEEKGILLPANKSQWHYQQLSTQVVKVSGYKVAPNSRLPTRPISRPGSPFKGSTSSPQSPSQSPVIRPRAKVNSSATIARKPPGSSSVPSTSRITVGAANISRPTSPFKSNATRSNLGLTPASAVKARVTVHTPSKSTDAVSTPSSPESRQRAFTAIGSDVSRSNHDRQRRGSFSLHHTYSSSSLNASHTFTSPVTSPSQLPAVDYPQSGLGPIKVKAKISGLAKSTTDNASSLSFSPSTRPTHSRTRAPSISSSIVTKSASGSPPTSDQQVYPITTGVRAASPYRFATSKHSPPSNQHHYRPFLPSDEQLGNRNKPGLGVKVDPAAIPLPPLSPPTSAVSFSSHSSLSYTSTDSPRSFSTIASRVSPQAHSHKRELSIRSTPDDAANGVVLKADVSVHDDDNLDNDGEAEGKFGSAERKVKAEAKSNRKVRVVYI